MGNSQARGANADQRPQQQPLQRGPPEHAEDDGPAVVAEDGELLLTMECSIRLRR